MSCDILVEDVSILTMNALDEFIPRGAVAIKNSSIADVGESKEVASRNSARVRIDGRGRLLMPGLVNAHVHISSSIMRGIGEELPFAEWHQRFVFPMWQELSSEEAYRATLLSCVEAIRTGTTFLNNFCSNRRSESEAEALEKIGLRADVCHSISELPPKHEDSRGIIFDTKLGEEKLEENLSLIKHRQGRGDGRIRFRLGPLFTLACRPKLLNEIGRLSKELGVGVHMHLAESRWEVNHVRKLYGKGIVDHLETLNFLQPHLIGAHAVQVTPEEISTLARHDASVAVCPVSEAKLQAQIAPALDMVKRGLRVGIGSDSAACQNSFNMFQEMKFTSLLNKIRSSDPGAMTAHEVVRMATVGGAKALNLQIGSIEKGTKADLIIIDRAQPELTPGFNPYSMLVHSGGFRVDTSIIDGKLIMEDGRIKTINEDKLLPDFQDALRNILTRMGGEHRELISLFNHEF